MYRDADCVLIRSVVKTLLHLPTVFLLQFYCSLESAISTMMPPNQSIWASKRSTDLPHARRASHHGRSGTGGSTVDTTWQSLTTIHSCMQSGQRHDRRHDRGLKQQLYRGVAEESGYVSDDGLVLSMRTSAIQFTRLSSISDRVRGQALIHHQEDKRRSTRSQGWRIRDPGRAQP